MYSNECKFVTKETLQVWYLKCAKLGAQEMCSTILYSMLAMLQRYFLSTVLFVFNGSLPVMFVTKQSILIQFNTKHVYVNSVGYLYMYVTCFALYLGHPQACLYKNLAKEGTRNTCRNLKHTCKGKQ